LPRHSADKCPSHLAPILPECAGKVKPEPRRRGAGVLHLGAGQLQVGDGPEKEHKVDDVFSEPAGVVVTGRAVTDTTLYVVLVRQPGEAEARPA
jgi:hypothetical protein